MFIVFEGVDRSGKTSLSLQFAQKLNTEYRAEDGYLKIHPHLQDFIWTKEPHFSSDEADMLNTPGYVDEYKRERLFFESRLRHQKIIAGKNVVCDRYIWTGLAYSYRFSPGCFRFVKELYLSESLFIQPDLYVYVDTPPEVCCSRDSNLSLDVLRELRDAYLKSMEYLKTPIIMFPYTEGEQAALEKFTELFDEYAEKTGLLEK
jgi:thymidylate kinase